MLQITKAIQEGNWVGKGEAIKLRPDFSTQSKTHTRAGSYGMGKLYPVLIEEALPGDMWNITASNITRLATTLSPFFGDLRYEVSFYFVPNRLVWDEWETFITEGKSGDESPVFPTWKAPNVGEDKWIEKLEETFKVGELWDNLGLPLLNLTGIKDADTVVATNTQRAMREMDINVLPLRGIDLIYDWYYRNQEFQEESFDKNKDRDFKLKYLNWNDDYFTMSKPEQQRGTPPRVPISGMLNIKAYQKKTGSTFENVYLNTGQAVAGGVFYDNSQVMDSSGVFSNGESQLYVDLEKNGVGILMNDLYQVNAINEMQWLKMQVGYLYPNYLTSNFGFAPKDETLQIPENIGNLKGQIIVSEVVQTSGTKEGVEGDALGNLAGKGLGFQSNQQVQKYRTLDHGYIIGLMSIFPYSMYDQQINKKWSKKTSLDFFNPLTGNIPAQAIRRKELQVPYDLNQKHEADPKPEQIYKTENLDDIWAYTEAWEDLRESQSYTTGELRTTQNRNFYTLAREFSPKYKVENNADFHTMQGMSDRIFTIEQDKAAPLTIEQKFHIQVTRPIPDMSIPNIGGL